MKRLNLLACLAAGLLTACTNYQLNESNIDFTVTRVCSNKAWVEITPSSNAAYYMYDVVKASDMEHVENDREFIEEHYEKMQKIVNEINEYLVKIGYEPSTIEELYYERGSVQEVLSYLEPETDYCAFVYGVSKKGKPSHTLVKRWFTTTAQPTSDITFKVEMASSDTFRIIPSNTDPYFWDAIQKTSVYDYYDIDPSDSLYTDGVVSAVWFEGVINLNYEWGFNLTDTNTVAVPLDALSDAPLKDEDVFYVGCTGFTTEQTTGTYMFKITYRTNGTTSVEPIELINTLDEKTKRYLRKHSKVPHC